MSAKIIDGVALAEKIKQQLKIEAEEFFVKNKRKIGLAVILAGDDEASKIYVKNKIKACKDVSINSFSYYFKNNVTQQELIELINYLNNDKNVDGILVQLPLPKHISRHAVLSQISHKKDADGFLAINAGNLMLGNPSLNACTPCGIMELIKSTKIKIDSCQAVVIGRSNIVGKPVSLMLMDENATVTMCHSKTQNVEYFTRQADIVVAATGKKWLVKADMVKKGAVVIDVGMNRENGRLYGDVDFDSVREVAGFITPVPGGVGPMTIAMLLKNIIKAAKMFE